MKPKYVEDDDEYKISKFLLISLCVVGLSLMLLIASCISYCPSFNSSEDTYLFMKDCISIICARKLGICMWHKDHNME